MKSIHLVRKAGRSIRQNMTRSILTCFAIAIGSFILTLAIAAGEGTRQYSNRIVESNINPRVVFIGRDEAAVQIGNNQQNTLVEYDANSIATENGEFVKTMSRDDLKQLAARDDIESVTIRPQIRMKHMGLEGSNRKFVSPVMVYDSTLRYNVVHGELPPLGVRLNNNEIIVPKRFAETMVEKGALNSVEELLNKNIVLTVDRAIRPSNEEIEKAVREGGAAALSKLVRHEEMSLTLKVVAITDRVTTISNSLSGTLQISINAAEKFRDFQTKGTVRENRYVLVSALVKNGRNPQDVKKSLANAGFYALVAKDLQDRLFTIVNVLQAIAVIFGILALIASVFGVVNTQYISVLERTRQIGLMKALGMHNRDVARLYRYEAAWLGFLGGVLGAAVAWAASTALNPWINDMIGLDDSLYLLIFQPLWTAVLIAGLMAVAVVAGYLPSRRAAKLDPIEALRVE